MDIRRALAKAPLEVSVQPLANAPTEALSGFKALIRWRHLTRGPVRPGEFLPVAEEIGLIRATGAPACCADAARRPAHVKAAENLLAIQFAEGDLVRDVEQALAASGRQARGRGPLAIRCITGGL